MSFRTAVFVASIFLGLFTVLVIPASAQVIHACVNHASGDMKIVPAGALCQKNWTPLSWNVAGPPGPTGANGTALAAQQYFCSYQLVNDNALIQFSSSGVGFETSIISNGSSFSSIILTQP